MLRARIFEVPHLEGDERIYAALVEQLRAGHGYTLQGHPILEQDWMVREQYDTSLFYHPPGGIAWFLLFGTLFGARGPDLAQLAAFSIFFVSAILLAREVLPRWTVPVAWCVAVLAAVTPIVAHVSVHRWLDGPQLAALTMGAWLLAVAARRGGTGWAIAAGSALGAACLVKMNAPIAFPGVAALAYAASDDAVPCRRLRAIAIALAVAFALAIPWLLVEYRFFGTVFPSWAGRPSPRLVAENPFIHVITAVRTPWSYLRLLPLTVWTLVPACLTLVVLRPIGRARRVAAALAGWIVLVVAVNMALGGLGYSKLLRYVVLVSPATLLLAGLAAGEGLAAIGGRRRRAAAILVAFLAAGIALEAVHGYQVTRVYTDRAWIRPLFGEPR
jgi:4-amino-4-deoxy-L-arabinose transferase-like glycosyltransferase